MNRALHGRLGEPMAAKGDSKIEKLTALPGIGAATAKKLVSAKIDTVSKVASAGSKNSKKLALVQRLRPRLVLLPRPQIKRQAQQRRRPQKPSLLQRLLPRNPHLQLNLLFRNRSRQRKKRPQRPSLQPNPRPRNPPLRRNPPYRSRSRSPSKPLRR